MLVGSPANALTLALALSVTQAARPPVPLWTDITAETIGETALWTNKVEIADLNGDGRLDLLFANGGNYSDPGQPEPNEVFINNGPGKPFTRVTEAVLGPTADLPGSSRPGISTATGSWTSSWEQRSRPRAVCTSGRAAAPSRKSPPLGPPGTKGQAIMS